MVCAGHKSSDWDEETSTRIGIEDSTLMCRREHLLVVRVRVCMNGVLLPCMCCGGGGHPRYGVARRGARIVLESTRPHERSQPTCARCLRVNGRGGNDE